MSDPLNDPDARHRLGVFRHTEEVTGNVAMTCRYFGISRQLYYTWLRRYRAEGLGGVTAAFPATEELSACHDHRGGGEDRIRAG